MIKGSERKIIVIEKLDSPYFEKAYFFVKCGVRSHVSKKTLSVAAGEMFSSLEDYDDFCDYGSDIKTGIKSTKAKPKIHKGLGVILLCASITLILSFIIFLLI